MKMNKKSQISVFIIAGILISLILLGSLYLNKVVKEKNMKAEAERKAEISMETQEIKSFIDSCIEKTAFEGLKILGNTGGYIGLPRTIEFQGTSFWYLDEVNIQPTLNETLKRLEEYIDINLPICIDDFNKFKEQGYIINYEKPKSKVVFAAKDVKVDVNYPVKIEKDFVNEFNEFSVNLDIRFRRIFELASQIIYRQLEPDFKFSSPLDRLNKFDFDVSYLSNDEDEIIAYTITDNTRQLYGENFKFRLASRFKHSDLIRTVELQENSDIVPTILPYIIYSMDRMAQLFIFPGTTFNLNSQSVDSISVQQFYPGNVTREYVPFHEHADNSVEYGDLTWNTSYPVYEFLPTGLRFNYPQRLALFWDEDRIPHQGNMGILYDEGEGWRPLPSKANYDWNYIYTDIPGFSKYTVIDCGKQYASEVSAEAEAGGESSCYTKLIITIIIIIIIIIAIVLTVGAAAPAAAGAGGTAGTGSTVTAGAAGSATMTTGAAAGTVTATGAGTGAAATGVSVGTATTATTAVTTTTAAGTTTLAAGSTIPAGTTIVSGTVSVGSGATVTMGAGASATLGGGATATMSSAAGAISTGTTIASAGMTAGLLTGAGAATAATTSGILSTLGAASTALFTGALTHFGMAVVLIGGIVGGAYIASGDTYGTGQDQITFTPTCEQTIEIHKQLENGEGKCMPGEGSQQVNGGQPVQIIAALEKCKGIRKYVCGKCTLKCSTSYR